MTRPIAIVRLSTEALISTKLYKRQDMSWLIGVAVGWVNLVILIVVVLVVGLIFIQAAGAIVLVASVIAYHNDPHWGYVLTGVAGAAVFVFADWG
jgi:hypothetical protein